MIKFYTILFSRDANRFHSEICGINNCMSIAEKKWNKPL